jgi:hypothetical protein
MFRFGKIRKIYNPFTLRVELSNGAQTELSKWETRGSINSELTVLEVAVSLKKCTKTTTSTQSTKIQGWRLSLKQSRILVRLRLWQLSTSDFQTRTSLVKDP